jgi:hypothetical protein
MQPMHSPSWSSHGNDPTRVIFAAGSWEVANYFKLAKRKEPQSASPETARGASRGKGLAPKRATHLPAPPLLAKNASLISLPFGFWPWPLAIGQQSTKSQTMSFGLLVTRVQAVHLARPGRWSQWGLPAQLGLPLLFVFAIPALALALRLRAPPRRPLRRRAGPGSDWGTARGRARPPRGLFAFRGKGLGRGPWGG